MKPKAPTRSRKVPIVPARPTKPPRKSAGASTRTGGNPVFSKLA